MFAFDDLEYDEIAEKENIPIGTVKSRIFKARQKLRNKYEKFYQENCLMEQSFIKDPAVTVKDLLAQKIAKIGENMNIRRFTRYQLGEA